MSIFAVKASTTNWDILISSLNTTVNFNLYKNINHSSVKLLKQKKKNQHLYFSKKPNAIEAVDWLQ